MGGQFDPLPSLFSVKNSKTLRLNFYVILHPPSRSSRSQMLFKIGAFKKFAIFTGKHLCQILFFNKVAGLRPTNLLKKRPWHKCFPVNFAKFLKIPFF